VTRRSSQIWARGNGWIGMALADALLTVSKKSSYRKPLEKALKNYISYVAPLQHKETGYWYQLMTLPNDPQNFDESSSTAMFSYAITIGLKLKLIPASVYDPIIDRAYDALKTTGVSSTTTLKADTFFNKNYSKLQSSLKSIPTFFQKPFTMGKMITYALIFIPKVPAIPIADPSSFFHFLNSKVLNSQVSVDII
jgi:rhamnogalacturonyl hydrolase YesR